MTLRKKAFENIEEPAFSPFPATFSTLPNKNFKFWIPFILLCANSFSMDGTKIFSFGKELINRGSKEPEFSC